jgi:molybdopterin-guanine dinucleotide biosynthesis protein A
MGRPKITLPLLGRPCLDYVLEAVGDLAGRILLVGEAEGLEAWDVARIPDERPGMGPLGGLEAGLRATATDWNLVLAGDLPCLTRPFLEGLLGADRERVDAVVAEGAGRVQPLCGLYHRRILPVVRAHLEEKRLSLQDLLRAIRTRTWPAPDPACLLNVNRPEDVPAVEACLRGRPKA